ncbi:D-alanyl-D-alanine carboxypeptidase/D-alanyl-D-alanine endopeptidase [Miltoncostaea marina]|uniref:D-alanyl-D-alanine carboxypeptidase/D-alanyl-D-alanine endopeptidase n=1 Tax=Miltoncostaea marina TaxID=2843215 RepID=UPI001C3D6C4A|nr:D-alanyl-D-alanine carboxypeptidase/D-alanyl-D-alanine-endopeptidase [Miltoncostaea marina]
MQRAVTAFTATNPATTALVWRLDGAGGGATVASFRPATPRIPASTMKLVTAAGAFLEMGPDHRFRTNLYAAPGARTDGRVLRGALHLRGSGDPVLATRGYARRYLPQGATALAELGAPLRARGIRLVRGPIVADETLFDARRMGPGWPSYYRSYASPLSALTTNQNYAGNGRARHVTSPTLAAAQRLRGTLRGLGIRHAGPLRHGGTPKGSRLLATAVSPRLRAIVRQMNLESDNTIAETLMKGIGAHGAGRGTTAAGAARIREHLERRGILGPGDRLVDGSGLSRANRLSAATLVRLIAAADADRAWGGPLVHSLARGGEGTLVRRFTSGPATKRVRAKTGYLDCVSAMAGRVVSRRGQRYAFALVANSCDIWGARAAQDRVVTLLAAGSADLRPGGPATAGVPPAR